MPYSKFHCAWFIIFFFFKFSNAAFSMFNTVCKPDGGKIPSNNVLTARGAIVSRRLDILRWLVSSSDSCVAILKWKRKYQNQITFIKYAQSQNVRKKPAMVTYARGRRTFVLIIITCFRNWKFDIPVQLLLLRIVYIHIVTLKA